MKYKVAYRVGDDTSTFECEAEDAAHAMRLFFFEYPQRIFDCKIVYVVPV